MGKALVPDKLWDLVWPLLPKRRPPRRSRRHRGGRPPLDDRAALTGILFVLKTGIPWEYLPAEMNCGSGMSCWRRLRDWHRAGVWQKLHEKLLCQLRAAGCIDFSRAVVDSASVRAVLGGRKPAQIRRIGARADRSITCSPTPTGRR
jgi:transposase